MTPSSEQPRYISATSRPYTAMGSVIAKILADQKAKFTVLSYHPPDKRIKAKAAQILKSGVFDAIRISTEKGSYELAANALVLLSDGIKCPISSLRENMSLMACELRNVEGYIFIETANRTIPLFDLIEADSHGLPFQEIGRPVNKAPAIQKVTKIEKIGVLDAFTIQVDCPSTKRTDPLSGHNFLIWPDGTSFGSGIFAC